MKQDDGNCKGGLTVGEWEAVENAAEKHLKKSARDRVIELLYAGKIHSMNGYKRVENAWGVERRGHVYLNTASVRGDASGNKSIVNIFKDPIQLAKTAAHESQHVVQSASGPGLHYWLYNNSSLYNRLVEHQAERFARSNMIW